jgi:hypothetical protein
MTVIGLLATSLNRRDDRANKALALEIISGSHSDWIKELADNLKNKDKNIQGDCIKVLYETGLNGAPQLIAPYLREFGELLSSKNNRMVWGAMIAIDMITEVDPDGVNELLPSILKTMEKGSVITIDHGVGILAKLSAVRKFEKKTLPLLIDQLVNCPIKQLPMYAGKSVVAVNQANKDQFIEIIGSRISGAEKGSQKSRLEKLIKSLKSKQ